MRTVPTVSNNQSSSPNSNDNPQPKNQNEMTTLQKLSDPFTLVERDGDGQFIIRLETLQNLLEKSNLPIAVVTIMGQPKWREYIQLQIRLALNCLSGSDQKPIKGHKSLKDVFVSLTPFLIEVKGDEEKKDKKMVTILFMEISQKNLSPEIFAKLMDISVCCSTLTLLLQDQNYGIHWAAFQSLEGNLSGKQENHFIVLKKSKKESTEGSTPMETDSKVSKSFSSKSINWDFSFASLLQKTSKIPNFLKAFLTRLDLDDIHLLTGKKLRFGFFTDSPASTLDSCQSSHKDLLTLPDFVRFFQSGISSLSRPSSSSLSLPLKSEEERNEELNSIKSKETKEEFTGIAMETDDPSPSELKTDVSIQIDEVASDAMEVEEFLRFKAEHFDSSNDQFPILVETEGYWVSFLSKYKQQMEEKIYEEPEMTPTHLQDLHSHVVNTLWSGESLKCPPTFQDNFLRLISDRTGPLMNNYLEENKVMTALLFDLRSEIWVNIGLKVEKQVASKIEAQDGPENLKAFVFVPLMFNKFKTLNGDLQGRLLRWYEGQLNIYLGHVNFTILALQFYNNEFNQQLRRMLCLSNEDFESCHNQILTLTLEKFPLPPDIAQIHYLFNWSINFIHQSLSTKNQSIYQEEEKIAKVAVNHAMTSYKQLMVNLVSKNFLSDSQLQKIHEEVSGKIADSFVSVFSFPQQQQTRLATTSSVVLTRPWKTQLGFLKDAMSQGLSGYLETNATRLAKIKTRRKISTRVGESLYREKLREIFMGAFEFELGRNKLFLHKAAMAAEKVAREKFKDEAGDVPTSLKDRWWEVMRSSKFVQIQESLYEEVCKARGVEKSQSGRKEVDEQEEHRNSSSLSEAEEEDNIIGVSIFLAPEITRIGIYKDGQLLTLPHSLAITLPVLAFTGDDILFGEEANRFRNENKVFLFSLLRDIRFDSEVQADIRGQRFHLNTEQVLAIFFRHLKVKIEDYLNEIGMSKVVSSCSMVTTMFMATACRQRLKNSLKLAGFEETTLMHTTTAIGLSHILQRRDSLKTRQPILLVHRMNASMDIAFGFVSPRCLMIKAVKSWTGRVDDDTVSLCLGQILTSSNASLTSKDIRELNVVLVNSDLVAEETDEIDITLLNMRTGSNFPGFPKNVKGGNENSGILLGSGMWDAQKRSFNSEVNYFYTEARPYALCMSSAKKYFCGLIPMKVQLDRVSPLNPVRKTLYGTTLTIMEKVRERELTVATYKTETGSNDDFHVSFDLEGFFRVNVGGHVLKPEFKETNFMDPEEVNNTMDKIDRIFKIVQGKRDEKCVQQSLPQNDNVYVMGEKTVGEALTKVTEELPSKEMEVKETKVEGGGGAEGDKTCEELKKKLIRLVEDVQGRISREGNSLKNSMILERVQELLADSKRIIEDKGSKERLLKRTFQNLGNYADKLK